MLVTLCSQSHVAIQCGDLKHQFNKNQTTSKKCQKLRENFFIAKNIIFADYKFLKIFFKNRFALVCGKFKYVHFERYRKLPSFRRFTFYTKMSHCRRHSQYQLYTKYWHDTSRKTVQFLFVPLARPNYGRLLKRGWFTPPPAPLEKYLQYMCVHALVVCKKCKVKVDISFGGASWQKQKLATPM